MEGYMQGDGRPQSIWLMVYARNIPGRIKVGTGDGVQRVSFSGCRLEFPATVPPHPQCCVTGEARRASRVVRI